MSKTKSGFSIERRGLELRFRTVTLSAREGLAPDFVRVRLTGADLAAFKDPALARAVEKAGGQISPEAAGKLFPIEWDN